MTAPMTPELWRLLTYPILLLIVVASWLAKAFLCLCDWIARFVVFFIPVRPAVHTATSDASPDQSDPAMAAASLVKVKMTKIRVYERLGYPNKRRDSKKGIDDVAQLFYVQDRLQVRLVNDRVAGIYVDGIPV